MLEKQLAERKTIDAIITLYQTACEKVDEGYRLLEEAERELNFSLSPSYSSFGTIERNGYHGPRAAESVRKRIKMGVWRHIINRMEIRKVLSVKRAEELDERLEDPDKLPELTTANVFDLFASLIPSANTLAMEAVCEVFEFMRPAQNQWGKHYKTNQVNGQFELGKKIIKVGWVCSGYGKYPYRVNNYRNQELIALDRVFHMLDGKGIPEGYTSPVVDAINTSRGQGETDYFKFVCYRNGNLHLEFRRMDLVTKINQIAGDPTRLRDGGKRARK